MSQHHQLLPLRRYVRQPAALKAGSSHSTDRGRASASGAPPSGSAHQGCAGGDPIGNHAFPTPQKPTESPQVLAPLIGSCLHFPGMLMPHLQSSGNEINLLELEEGGKSLGSYCDMCQSGAGLSTSTRAGGRTWECPEIRNKPQDEDSNLGSDRRGDRLAPTPGIMPKSC